MVVSGQAAAGKTGCPACEKKAVDIFALPFPSFKHLDFTEFFPAPTRIGRCAECGHVFLEANERRQRLMRTMFEDASYLRHDESHRVIVPGEAEPVSAPRLQARLLAPRLPQRPAICDIGCWNGALLGEFSRLTDARDLCGFDVIRHPLFPKERPYRFSTGMLSTLDGVFDLIVLSHSIQYVEDLSALFSVIRQRLAPFGTVYVQVPDFTRKPCSLLLGDLRSHFTTTTVANLFRIMGFEPTQVVQAVFPRDVAMTATQAPPREEATRTNVNELSSAITRIGDLADSVAALPSGGRLAVLGTTIEAAFVESLMPSRVEYFVDENPSKIESGFHGKTVASPDSVKAGDLVVVPMGDAGAGICRRLRERYLGTYVSV